MQEYRDLFRMSFISINKITRIFFDYLKYKIKMEKQNFKNHSRFLPDFHLLTFGIILVTLILSLVMIFGHGIDIHSVFAFLVSASLGLLFYYIRTFVTGNQDRIIRAEENFRSFRLTGKELDGRLTREQIIALRFADDQEYISLTEKAIKENMSLRDIKQSIVQWRPDHHRV
jgi:hypothetical protein